jgi:GAF domain
MTPPDVDRLRETERWIAWVRLAAVPFAIVEVGLLSTDYPPGYEGWAWATTGLALSSSLDLDEAFEAFIRELRGFVPFDRMAIVLEEAGTAQVLAVAGVGAEVVFSRGSRQPVGQTLLDEILRTGQTVYREDMTDARYSEEREFGELGLRSRIAAPLLHGPRGFGMISLVRREPSGFDTQELELVGLLGRLVASAVRTSAPMRPSATPSRSSGGCPPSVPTSSRSFHMSSGLRWRRSWAPPRRCASAGESSTPTSESPFSP